jgi:hypothetical protein
MSFHAVFFLEGQQSAHTQPFQKRQLLPMYYSIRHFFGTPFKVPKIFNPEASSGQAVKFYEAK